MKCSGLVHTVLLVLAGFALPAAASPPPTTPLPQALDAYVRAALSEWEIPGAAIAVVKDAQPAALLTYGVSELGRTDPVDADTIFDAASLAKSFTAAAIATLVDEGRLSWDDAVHRWLPQTEFPDPCLTSSVTIRDLLSHRTGVAATNGVWYFARLKANQIPGLVKHMTIDAPFRTRLVYSNVGYTVAGEAAAAAAGMSWEDLVTRRLIVPLGMTRTTADFNDAPSLGNLASGHALIAGSLRPTPRETGRAAIAPAGSILSSASDLARWMIFQLGDGTHDGQRILSQNSLDQMHSPQVIIPTTPAMRAARQVRFFPGYGLGWQVMDYRGEPMLWHTGAGDGQRVYMAIYPEAGLGVVVLLNASKVEMLHSALASRIIDHYLELPARDYCAELREPWQAQLRAREQEVRDRLSSRRADTAPSRALSAYAGTYTDQFGLDVSIVEEHGALAFLYAGGEPATLEHWQDDTFVVRWQNPLHAETYFTLLSFEVGGTGRADRLRTVLTRNQIEAVRKDLP